MATFSTIDLVLAQLAQATCHVNVLRIAQDWVDSRTYTHPTWGSTPIKPERLVLVEAAVRPWIGHEPDAEGLLRR